MRPKAACIITSAILAAANPTFPQQCLYETVAGRPTTFAGEGVDVSGARFYQPSAVAVGSDGSLYIADTGNHRIRRILPSGLIKTVAGTGQPAFAGDGGAATGAALQRPSGLAVATNGTVYISDTGNHRIRSLSTDGNIHTVAGDGKPMFKGDGAPAAAASLNQPTTIVLDNAGNLYVLDEGNNRVRRIDTGGRITTVAGGYGNPDYSQFAYCCDDPTISKPALQADLHFPIGLAVDPNSGQLYIEEASDIRTVTPDGTISMFLQFSYPSHETPLTTPVPLSGVSIGGALMLGLDTSALLLTTSVQTLLIQNGTAFRTAGPLPAVSLAEDHRTGDIIALQYTGSLTRLHPDRTIQPIYTAPLNTDPSAVTSALDLDLQAPQAVATGPNGPIYVLEQRLNRVLAIGPDGRVRLFAGGGFGADGGPAAQAVLYGPSSLAVNSQGVVYVAESLTQRIRKVLADGTIQTAYVLNCTPMSVRVDGQDAVYAFCGSPVDSQIFRFDKSGSSTLLFQDPHGGFFPGLEDISEFPGMAVARDGTVYVGITGSFSNTQSTILKLAPGGQLPALIPMELRARSRAIAVAPTGEVYMVTANATTKRILPDGTLVTVRNRDELGFWGEYGSDSAPALPYGLAEESVTDLAVDGQGRLLVVDSALNAVRRFQPSQCNSTPGPVLGGVLESATSDAELRLTAGQLFSLYGLRLGPSTGVSAELDNTGKVSTELAGTQVLVNGLPAPLLFVRKDQINAIVPFELEGQDTIRLEVATNGNWSDVFPALLAYYAPAPFSLALSSGLYARMLNQDGSINDASHPAKLGSIVSLFVTGLGATVPPGTDGAIAGATPKIPLTPVRVAVQGQDAEVIYVGTAPTLVEGVMQINCRLPSALPGWSGPVAQLSLAMGLGVPQADVSFYVAQ